MSGTTEQSNDPVAANRRRSRMIGPGVALAILAAAAVYTFLSRADHEPAEVAAETSAPRPPAVPPQAPAAPTRPAGNVTPRPATATTATAPTPATGQEAPGDEPVATGREAVRKAAHQYRDGRFNAFFRKDEFLEKFARGGREQITSLREELADPSALMALPADTNFLESKPEPVLERMAMIDLLHELAPKDPAAREAMISLELSPIDRALPDSVKKGLVGEKYDILFKLAQIDRQLAVDTYSKLENEKLKSLLRNALLAGLAESGASPDEVSRLTRNL